MNQEIILTSLPTALLKWYKRHKRDLPWRKSTNPFTVWISEIMLQQTQVATVIPYYLRFLKMFPNIKSLAKAPLEDVLKAWEGLGYYSRAGNLHRSAGRIVSRYNGKIPKTVEELIRLPGIGRYTAGAIASIAYGQNEPVLDGNVQRVYARVFRIRENLKETKIQQKLWSIAQQLLPVGHASEFNQALMDLGATVCIPRNPKCPICPVQTFCQARLHNEYNEIPIRIKRQPIPHYDIAAAVIWKGNKILIDQRKSQGLLGGLWEFPGGKKESGETLEECLIREISEEVGIKIKVIKKITAVNHAYSHFRITLHAFECKYLSGKPRPIDCVAVKWIKLGDLDQYPFPKANHKIFTVLRQNL
jgi:A/G-specific adenine glycosylase